MSALAKIIVSYRTVDRIDPVWRPVRLCTNAQLLNYMKRIAYGRHPTHDPEFIVQRDAVIAELRRRNVESHWLERVDPSPCACGRPGIYVVNTTTYCSKCRDQASDRLRDYANRTHEVRDSIKGKEIKEAEQQKLSKQRFKKSGKGHSDGLAGRSRKS